MQRTKLIICITACLLLTSVFAVVPVFSAQPPVDTTTYYMGTIGQPRNVDPVLAYDAASGELIFNVLEPLIFFNDHKFLPAETSKVNVTDLDDLNSFGPVLATAMPTVVTNTYDNGSARPGSNWTFTINIGIFYQDWTDENGTLHHHQNVTVDDVLYHFQWSLVEDSPANPVWMFNLPLTGYDYWDSFDTNATTNIIEPMGVNGVGERAVRDLIQNAMSVSGNSITFHFATDWNQTALYQTFAQTWSCIEPKDFCISHGCWDGIFADGWSKFRRYPSTSATPLDRHTAYSHYASNTAEPALCGSGPYKFTYWDQAAQQWRIDKFADYHGGWAGNHVDTVITTGVDAWPTRKMLFLQGEFDTAVVPTANMYDLLDKSAPDPVHTPIGGIILYYGIALFDFNMPDRQWHRDWVRNVEINQLYPGIYYYNRWKSAIDVLKQIDLDVTSTITPVVSFPTVYIFKSEMRRGYMGLGVGNASAAIQIYDIRVKRNDAVPGLVAAVIGLKRTNLTKSPAETFAYPNSTFVLLGPAPDPGITITLWHYEDGSLSTLPSSKTGVSWQIGARADVAQAGAQDTNLANNYVADGIVVAYSGLVTDFNGNGITDIFDALQIATHYGVSEGELRWNSDLNLSSIPDYTGKQTVDIFDLIMFAGNIDKHLQP